MDIKNKLIKLLNNSYSPYSNFRVASIVIMKDGKEFVGVNVENASYGAGICAERNAIIQAIANGYKKGDFETMYVMGDDQDDDDSEKVTSCMLCRQVILEFFEKDKKIISMSLNGDTESHTVEELCPYPFGEEDLK